MSSLQEQLLNAGLANSKQAKQASKAKKKQTKDQRRGLATGDDAQARAQLTKQANAERSKLLNSQREADKQQKEYFSQAKQIATRFRLDTQAGDQVYNFVDGKTIKRLHVTQDQLQWLSLGSLVIVAMQGQYHVVPASIGEKIVQRSSQCLLIKATNDQPVAADADDPYADFVIPDDLMW